MIRLALRVRREDAELVLAELLELAPGGVEEGDATATSSSTPSTARPGELPELPDLRAAAGGALVEVVTERGRRRLGRALEGLPPAGRRSADAARAPAVGSRRATGLRRRRHRPRRRRSAPARTRRRGCASSCCSSSSPAARCVDVGCGSGVLAIAAARLGWAPVLGVDHERESVAGDARQRRAPTASRVQARRHDLLRDGPAPGAPTVLANLLRPLLLRVAADGFAGARARRARRQRAAGRTRPTRSPRPSPRHGLRETARRHGGEWAALLLRR